MNGIKDGILQILNPSDYFTLAMDEEIRKEGMPGSLGGFALELDCKPDISQIASRIEEFTTRFPVSLASLQQRGRRFYWCERDKQRQVFFQHLCPTDQDEQSFQRTTLRNIINQHEPRETCSPIEFHLLSGDQKQTFMIRWLHPFSDARSADLILKYLCTDDQGQRKLFDTPASKPLINVQLEKFKWWQKMGLFIKAKHHIQEIDRLQSIIPFDNKLSPQSLNYSIQRLTTEQTANIDKMARQHVGLTGTSLYYLGCMMRALDKINPEQPGEAYCVPYAYNLRKNKALSPMLGNHVGAMFAQAPKNLVQDREQLFTHLKQQNINIIRQQVDYAFLPLMWAGCWLSLEKYGKTLRQSYTTHTERSSFWFSDIGQPDLSGQTFFGSKIIDVFHLCQVTTPPALALLSCKYQNRLTLTYNFMEPLINESWLYKLHEIMLTELLGESG